MPVADVVQVGDPLGHQPAHRAEHAGELLDRAGGGRRGVGARCGSACSTAPSRPRSRASAAVACSTSAATPLAAAARRRSRSGHGRPRPGKRVGLGVAVVLGDLARPGGSAARGLGADDRAVAGPRGPTGVPRRAVRLGLMARLASACAGLGCARRLSP